MMGRSAGKVLLVNQFSPPFALHRSNGSLAQRYARALRSMGLQVSVACARYGPIDNGSALPGTHAVFDPHTSWEQKPSEGERAEWDRVQLLVEKIGPDQIWFLHLWGLRPATLARLSNLPVPNLCLVGDESLRLHVLRTGGRHLLTQLRFDQVICNSEELGRRIDALKGLCLPRPPLIMRTGIAPIFFAPSSRPWQPRSNLRLLFVGRLVAHKRVDFAIRVWKECRQRERFSDAELTIAGEGHHHEYRLGLKGLAIELGGASQVHFVGHLDSSLIRAEMEAAQFLVFTSGRRSPGRTIEGTPAVLCEAFASGLPVLAAPGPSVDEVVLPGRTGWFNDENTPSAWADRIEALLDRPEEVRGVVASARSWVEENCDIRVLAKQLLFLGARG